MHCLQFISGCCQESEATVAELRSENAALLVKIEEQQDDMEHQQFWSDFQQGQMAGVQRDLERTRKDFKDMQIRNREDYDKLLQIKHEMHVLENKHKRVSHHH